MAEQLAIGRLMPPMGWNTAKEFGSGPYYMTLRVRCEAFGADWAVFRDDDGRPCAVTLQDPEGMQGLLENWED